MYTILISGVLTVVAGAIVIAKAVVYTSDAILVDRGCRDANAGPPLFAVLDDQRIGTRLGLALIALGCGLVASHIAGLELDSTAWLIVGALVTVFAIAHVAYARSLRASRSDRCAALLSRIHEAQDRERAGAVLAGASSSHRPAASV